MRPAVPLQRAPLPPCGSRTPFRSNPRAARERNAANRERNASNRLHRASPAASESSSSPPPPFSFTVDLKVRDSELDQFLVVNNANYSVYLQHARHEFLEQIGLPVAAATVEGGALALSRLVLNFKAPLRSGDVARVGVRVTSARGARVEMEQWVDAIRRRSGEEGGEQAAKAAPSAAAAKEEEEEEEPTTTTIAVRALDAEATVVALDGRYRPTRLPRAVQRALETGERVPEGTRWFSSSEGGSSTSSDSGSDLEYK